MTWSEHTWCSIEPVYGKIIEHDFINELMNGTLPYDKFLFYLRQDSFYLTQYGKVLAGLAAKLNTVDHMESFLRFAGDTILVERALHESFLKDAHKGLPLEVSPSCMLYTGYLSQLLATNSVETTLAAVLPCFWIYKKVGDHILENQTTKENPFQSWIDTYGGDEFAQAVDKAIAICDHAAQAATEAQRKAMTEAFAYAAKMEWMFWDSAYRMEQWPI
jgi:thiaminase/transcriptional activator TenA